VLVQSTTHVAALDQVDALLHAAHSHEHEHDGDVGDRVGEDTRRVANLDAASVGGLDVNVVWEVSVGVCGKKRCGRMRG
jgi:hypothetical protein